MDISQILNTLLICYAVLAYVYYETVKKNMQAALWVILTKTDTP